MKIFVIISELGGANIEIHHATTSKSASDATYVSRVSALADEGCFNPTDFDGDLWAAYKDYKENTDGRIYWQDSIELTNCPEFRYYVADPTNNGTAYLLYPPKPLRDAVKFATHEEGAYILRAQLLDAGRLIDTWEAIKAKQDTVMAQRLQETLEE